MSACWWTGGFCIAPLPCDSENRLQLPWNPECRISSDRKLMDGWKSKGAFGFWIDLSGLKKFVGILLVCFGFVFFLTKWLMTNYCQYWSASELPGHKTQTCRFKIMYYPWFWWQRNILRSCIKDFSTNLHESITLTTFLLVWQETSASEVELLIALCQFAIMS